MTWAMECIFDDDGWKVRDLRALRRDRIGFVFQAPYLIPFLDVTDNVALLPMLAGVPNGARAQALELLTRAGCPHRAARCPRSCRAASSNGSPSPRAGQSSAGDPGR